MTIAVLDASPVGGGPVARSLALAARRSGCASSPVRVYDLLCGVCDGCTACAGNGRCTRRHARIEAALARLAAADTLLAGVSAHLGGADPRAKALLVRLTGAFAHVETRRGVERGHAGPGSRSDRRAALVCSASPLASLPLRLGLPPVGLDGIWDTFERGGVDVIACEIADPRWSGPAAWDRTSRIAERLVSALAVRRTRVAPVPQASAARNSHRGRGGLPAIARTA